MSLIKLLKAPIKLFKKEVITFLTIRRYDLDTIDEKLHYVAVKPTASIFVLRQKVWHLLDLPDFCEEIIILKSDNNVVIPLSDLTKGNDPQHPYVLEVWLPKNNLPSVTTFVGNMLEIGNGEEKSEKSSQLSTHTLYAGNQMATTQTRSAEAFSMTNRTPEAIHPSEHDNFLTDFKSDLSARMSTISLFKSNRKGRDNFTNVLLKIQSDLSTLSNKLSSLENRMVS